MAASATTAGAASGESEVEIESETSTSFIKLALENGIEIHELQPVGSNLEDIFLELTSGRSDYVGEAPSVSSDTKGMSNA
jgi:hypothetical protein